jgi:hypothetical protein
MKLSENLLRVVGGFSLCSIVLTAGGMNPLRADDRLNCAQPTDPDLAIRACTDLIIEGYTNRGIAFGVKGDHERAIADFEKARQLDQAPGAGSCDNEYRTAAGIRKSLDRGKLCPH